MWRRRPAATSAAGRRQRPAAERWHAGASIFGLWPAPWGVLASDCQDLVVRPPGRRWPCSAFLGCAGSRAKAWLGPRPFAGDDGAVGIVFLLEGVVVRTSTIQGQIQVKIKEPTHWFGRW